MTRPPAGARQRGAGRRACVPGGALALGDSPGARPRPRGARRAGVTRRRRVPGAPRRRHQRQGQHLRLRRQLPRPSATDRALHLAAPGARQRAHQDRRRGHLRRATGPAHRRGAGGAARRARPHRTSSSARWWRCGTSPGSRSTSRCWRPASAAASTRDRAAAPRGHRDHRRSRFDHMEYLGHTLAAIAGGEGGHRQAAACRWWWAAGRSPKRSSVIEARRAQARGAALRSRAATSTLEPGGARCLRSTGCAARGAGPALRLRGPHQLQNAAVALACLERAGETGACP